MLNRFKIAVVFISLGASNLLTPNANLYAQYVDTVLVTDTQHEFTFCYNWDYNYLTSVSELRDSNTNIYGWGYLQFKQYDENFNVILETRFQDSNYRYFGWRNLSFLNDAYYFGGLKYNLQLGTDSEGYLIKFDTVGNIIWERNYYTNVESSRVLIVEPNNDKLHVVGENYYPSTTNQNEVFLIQTDTSGAPQWTKTFNQAYGQAPISHKVTSDGGGVGNYLYIE